jgi:2TM domain
MTNLVDDRPTDIDSSLSSDREKLARQEAIKQIERRRRFKVSTVVSGLGMIILVAIWSMTEYHNAGGWPVNGFSQSSGIHDVWNFWIVYPVGAWVFLTAAFGLGVYRRRSISESDIKREMERQSGPSR